MTRSLAVFVVLGFSSLIYKPLRQLVWVLRSRAASILFLVVLRLFLRFVFHTRNLRHQRNRFKHSACRTIFQSEPLPKVELRWAEFLGKRLRVSTVGKDEHSVREYIRNQEQEDRRVDQLNLLR